MERLGSDDAKCAICGLSDPICLEFHHLAGRRYDEEGVMLCRNHHAVLSDAQRDHPSHSPEAVDPLEAFGRFLLGLADLFALLIGKLREIGEALIRMVQTDCGVEP